MSFFDYFQIATVATVVFIILSKAGYLRFGRKINAIVAGRDSRGLSRVFELAAFGGLIFWMIEILLYAFHSGAQVLPRDFHYQLFDNFAAKIAGVVLVTGGLVIFVLAFFDFGDSWRVGVDYKTPGALVTKGIFSVTRNPIYVFIGSWFIGIFLINGTVIFLVFAVLAVMAQHWQILREEKFLTKRHGESYQHYRETTPRYLLW